MLFSSKDQQLFIATIFLLLISVSFSFKISNFIKNFKPKEFQKIYCHNNNNNQNKLFLSANTNSIVETVNSNDIDHAGESEGIKIAIDYLNSSNGKALLNKLCFNNNNLREEAEKANFWTGGDFVITNSSCIGIIEEGLQIRAECQIKGKKENRDILVEFPYKVSNEVILKSALISIALSVNRLQDTGSIMKLKFGQNCEMPFDFKFNNVPHSTWVRSYLYNSAVDCILKTVKDKTIPNKSRLQMTVNYPEVNPAYDTYRIGTLLEMVRSMALALAEEEGMRVRICVQQALGEGIFVGLPLALSSMRPVLEKMDWGQRLSPEQKFQPGDNEVRRPEALIRLGCVGSDQVADDDEVFIIIAPQNVIGGMILDKLEEMVKAANGRPLILVNPSLGDRPSSNNMMQVRGRSERRAFADSFQDIYSLRLLYPSSGGYMFPIRGMIAKQDYQSPWVAYNKIVDEKGREVYDIIAAFDPYSPPNPTVLSELYTR